MRTVFKALEDGRYVPDQEFDRIFPEDIRSLSEIHWTPIEIARRAAGLLVVDATTRVLDVGSGCGKFCLVGSLTTSGQFHGVEQRPHLVQLARSLTEAYGMKRVVFTESDVRTIDWSRFQSFYLYNPFIENIYDPIGGVDESIALSESRYFEVVRWVQAKIDSLPLGTRVATYHGFGGHMPSGYRLIVQEPCGGDFLRLWIKTA
jgi:cyclopropane fatty-acyl-phospholipid synthase-like methyltransferase